MANEKRRNVMLKKADGEDPNASEIVPGRPVFRLGVPVPLNEKDARSLVRSNPRKFRFATRKDFPKKRSRSRKTRGHEGGQESKDVSIDQPPEPVKKEE